MLNFLREVYNIWVAERPTQLAAALAYYSSFTIVPIIYVALTVAQLFLGEALSSETLYLRMADILGPETATLLRDGVNATSQSTSQGSFLISLLTSL